MYEISIFMSVSKTNQNILYHSIHKVPEIPGPQLIFGQEYQQSNSSVKRTVDNLFTSIKRFTT